MKKNYFRIGGNALSVILSMICATPMLAQVGKTVQGTVTEHQLPLSGAMITEKGTDNHTFSDSQGNYQLTLTTDQAILIIETPNLSIREEEVKNRTIIPIECAEDTIGLNEVVLNAGYYTVKDKERTGSIARITAKEIEKQPVDNVLATLQGRMAGVEIIQDSGNAGGGFQIKIRGTNSLRAEANAPLYVVDGMPYNAEEVGYTTTSGNRSSLSNPIASLNIANIESIEVLKDADATAIYGSRGANGVVLITTKKGGQGETKVTVQSDIGFSKITRTIKLMNTSQYLNMRNRAFIFDGIDNYPSNAYDINGTWDQTKNTDWQKELIGNIAFSNNFRTSITGGNNLINYTLGYNHSNQKSVYPGNFYYKKNNYNVALNYKDKNEKFNIIFSSNYNLQDNNQPSTDLTTVARELAPNAPNLYSSDGTLNWENNTWENPLALLESKFLLNSSNLISNALINYNWKNFKFNVNLGYNKYINTEYRTFPSTMRNPNLGLGSESSTVEYFSSNRDSWMIEPQMNFNKRWENHTIEWTIGTTFQQANEKRLSISAAKFPNNNMLMSLSSAALQIVGLDDAKEYKYLAVYSRLNYKYNEKYIFNFTGRRDGSSRFANENRFANFGAVGVAWLFSKENIFKKMNGLNFGKIRSSYGITGSDNIGDYQYLDNYQMNANQLLGNSGLKPIRLYNPNYKWEINKKFEIALEMAFLNNRLAFDIAYYSNYSDNQLVGISIPSTTGFSSYNGNLDASVNNYGWELNLNTQNISNSNFKWFSNFNLSINRNKLVKFPNLDVSAYANTYIIGQPLNSIKLYKFKNYNNQTGLIEFEDANNDGNITAAFDKIALATLDPKFYGGLNNQFNYKNFTLNFLIQFVKQQRQNYYTNSIPGTMVNQMQNHSNYPLDYTTRSSQISANYNLMKNSDLSIVDASYIRFKNIALAYEMPKIDDKIKSELYLQGHNLFTITSYKGGDPEFKYNRFLPPLKTVVIGWKLTF